MQVLFYFNCLQFLRHAGLVLLQLSTILALLWWDISIHHKKNNSQISRTTQQIQYNMNHVTKKSLIVLFTKSKLKPFDHDTLTAQIITDLTFDYIHQLAPKKYLYIFLVFIIPQAVTRLKWYVRRLCYKSSVWCHSDL